MVNTSNQSFLLSLTLLTTIACDSAETPTEAQPKPVEQVEKVEPAALSTMFTGGQVTLPVTGLKLGMTLAEAQQAWPKLVEGGSLQLPQYPDVEFQTQFWRSKLYRVHFQWVESTREAANLITKPWGMPHSGTVDDETWLGWFNPETGVRLRLHGPKLVVGSPAPDPANPLKLDFSRYLPIGEFLGDGPTLAFERDAPLLGLSKDDLASKYADALVDRDGVVALEYLPLDWADPADFTVVELGWSAGGAVESLRFRLEFGGNPKAMDAIMAVMKAKWGEPTVEKPRYESTFVFSTTPSIRVRQEIPGPKHDEGAWIVEVRAAPPI